MIRHAFLFLACLSASGAAGAQALPPAEPIQPAPATAPPADDWQRAMHGLLPLTLEDLKQLPEDLKQHMQRSVAQPRPRT